MSAPTTLPLLLRRNRERLAKRPALREKDLGIWQSWTWSDYYEAVEAFALGLAGCGFRRGDRLAIIGDNRRHLYAAQLAAQCLGGVAVPVYQDGIAAELHYVLSHAEVSVVLAEDQEQVDKILPLKSRLPELRLLIYDDPRGMRRYGGAGLKSFAEVSEEGRGFAASHKDTLAAEIDKGRAQDLALLSYTSGTTGHPKGVMLSHENLIAVAEAFALCEDIRASDEFLSYLPMAWIGDSFFSLALSLYVGFACNCPERPESVERDLRELGPTVAFAPPRIWESLLARLRARAGDASPLKRRVFELFCGLAEKAELRREAGRKTPLAQRLALLLGEFLVYGPVRDQLGLKRARWVYTGGAPLGPDTFRFFRSFGINLKELWGATELSGVASLQPDGEASAQTVGRVLPGSELRIAEGGEIEIRSPSVFLGYFKDEKATAEAMTGDGWFRSGDAGHLDERAHLVIVDRAKDVGRLADGSPFAPQFIENKLKFSPFIGEAVTFGDSLPFVAAILAIDQRAVGAWAERRGLPFTSFGDLSAKPEVRRLIAEEIAQANRSLPQPARVRRFLLLNKEFDADDNEITRTRKIRRRFIAEKYAAVRAALYEGTPEVELSTEITYEDGRKATLKSRLLIEEIGEERTAAEEPAYA